MVLALALLAPVSNALASSCALGPFVQTQTPSLQCDIVIYRLASYDVDPKLQVHRDGAWVDVTGAVQKSSVQLPVSYEELGCNREVLSTTTNDHAFDIYRVTSTARLGEQIHVDGIVLNPVTDAACEPVAAPELVCPLTSYPCDTNLGDDIVEDGGCSTTRGPSGAALVLLALLAMSRRSRKLEVSGRGASALHDPRA